MYQELHQNIILYKKDLVPAIFSDENYSTMSRRQYYKVAKGRNGTGYIFVHSITRPDIIAKIEAKFGKIPPKPIEEKEILQISGSAQSYYSCIEGLSLSQIEKYTVKFSIFQALDRKSEEIKAHYSRFNQRITKIKLHEELLKHYNELAYENGLEVMTSDRFIERYYIEKYVKKGRGYDCVLHKNIGNQVARKVFDREELFINRLFARFRPYKPNKAEIDEYYQGFKAGTIEVINIETGECYSPDEFPNLSTSTIYNYISTWENYVATTAIRSGDRQKLMAATKPYKTFDRVKYSGSIISVDDRQPPFFYDDKRNRVWFYNAVDIASEAIVCWVYGKDKKGLITEFYRQLVANFAEWNLNLPDEIECESSLNSSFKDSFLKQGSMFQNVTIHANNARAKACERFWERFRYEIEKKRYGWIARFFAKSEANQMTADQAKKIPILDYDEIVENCIQDIENWNNAEHSQAKGKTRWEVFLENQNPTLQPTRYINFTRDLGRMAKSSCNAGIIRFDNDKYLIAKDGKIATSDTLLNIMSKVEGKNIEIYSLNDNDGGILKAYAYIGDVMVCEIMKQPSIGSRAKCEKTEEDLKNDLIVNKYITTITAYQQRRANELREEKLLIIDNRQKILNNKFQVRKNNISTVFNSKLNEINVLETKIENESEKDYCRQQNKDWRNLATDLAMEQI